MDPHDSVSRRMAGLFALALALIAWQTTRVVPLPRPAYEMVSRRGEQLFPVAVSSVDERPLIRTPPTRLDYLRALSVRSTGTDAVPDDECELYVRIARHHWRRLDLPRATLARRILGTAPPVRVPTAELCVFTWSGADFLDDDDGDGDRLDDGELKPSGDGAQVEVWCRP